jgi:hypothetical protein
LQVIIIFVSLGVTLDFARVKTGAFWIETALQFITTMVVFNTVYNLSKNNKTHDIKSRFFIAYATNRLRIKDLEKNKRYKDLDDACEKENFERLKTKCNHKLYKICSRICYDDIINDAPIEELIEEFKVAKNKHLLFSNLINNYKRHRFQNLVNKIRAGEIKVKPIKSIFFLIDIETTINSFDTYDLNVYVETVQKNLKKSIKFLACSFFSAVIGFSFYSPYFLKTLFTSITLILSACVSGFVYANRTIRERTALYEKRNSFLSNYLDIKIEYKEETTV